MNKCISNKGSYNITFSGDFEGHVDFIIADNIKTGGEILTEYPRIINMLKITFPIIILILLIMTIPFDCKICDSFQTRLNQVDDHSIVKFVIIYHNDHHFFDIDYM